MNGPDWRICTRGYMVCMYAKAQAKTSSKALLPSRQRERTSAGAV
jgi:hypothetical protein